MHQAVQIALLITTAAYAGFQATIRLLVYPQFAAAGRAEFVAYEAAHQRRVSLVVGPLFVAEAVSIVAALLDSIDVAAAATAAAFGVVVVLTALFAVPAHSRLLHGFDAAVHRRLLAIDTVRLVAALAAVAGAVASAL